MINLLFGPSGKSPDLMPEDIDVEKIPAILHKSKLQAFEYSFTHGVRMGESKAKSIKEAFELYGISLSVHAPYYINLSNPSNEMIEKTYGYFEQCLKIMPQMGATRLVFHPGALMGMSRSEALSLAKKNLKEIVRRLKSNGLLNGIYLCPETMGKHGQLGTPEEVAELSLIDDCLIPTIDFGHINAFTLGKLKSTSDFENVLRIFGDKLKNGNVHIHFSKVEYTSAGEKKHLNFCDEGEPSFKYMIDALKNLDLSGTIICESARNKMIDSIEMMKYCQKN